MLGYLTLIFSCQLAGELFVAATALPVPGPVIGMAILFAGLLGFGKLPRELASVADELLANLSLLFVPAGVGVILHMTLIGRDLLPISAALIVSTVLTVAVTALMMGWLNPPKDGSENARPEGEAH